MAQLPIRALTLYKQGIGYFERRGQTSERELSLIVPREATNDVLKSLTIAVQDGDTSLSVDYETPEDKAKTLGALPIKMTERAALIDLLSSLRGSQVALQLEDNQLVEGRIVGVEASLEANVQPPVVLLQQGEEVSIFPTVQVTGLRLDDERTRSDLGFFLDVSQTEQART